jgi:hypothetical protein
MVLVWLWCLSLRRHCGHGSRSTRVLAKYLSLPRLVPTRFPEMPSIELLRLLINYGVREGSRVVIWDAQRGEHEYNTMPGSFVCEVRGELGSRTSPPIGGFAAGFEVQMSNGT